MLWLRNKGQYWNKPLASFVASLCRQRSGVNCKPPLHDTRTVNLALVQSECHTGKQTIIARIKLVNLD